MRRRVRLRHAVMLVFVGFVLKLAVKVMWGSLALAHVVISHVLRVYGTDERVSQLCSKELLLTYVTNELGKFFHEFVEEEEKVKSYIT